jgi:hypothetical protein
VDVFHEVLLRSEWVLPARQATYPVDVTQCEEFSFSRIAAVPMLRAVSPAGLIRGLSQPARTRIDVALRAVAAVGGGYLLAALTAAVLGLHLPMSRVDAVAAGTLFALVVYPCAVMWCFAARTAARAWLGLAVPALLLALPVVLGQGGTA